MQTVGKMAEFGGLNAVAKLVIKEYALTERSHIHLHTIGPELTCQRKLTNLLSLEHHPVASRNAVLLRERGQ
jgi:hypothetical protein